MEKVYIHPTESVYEELLAAQQGECALCHRTWPSDPDEPTYTEADWHQYRKEAYDAAMAIGNLKLASTYTRRFLVQDHDHETGVVRGLLCASCNNAMGGVDKFLHMGQMDFVLREYVARGKQ